MTSALRRALGRLARVATVALALALVAPATASAYEAGVDVSGYQHGTSLDWSKVKAAGVDFAYIKATEGTSYTNPYLAGDWATTTKLGIYRGAYHFAYPSIGSAQAQASYFISKAGRAAASGDLPPVLDLEMTGGLTKAQLATWVSQFLVKVKSLTGRTPIIYCSPSFWSDHVGSTAFGGYPLWIAHYTSASQPTIPQGWSRWTFWQNTSAGEVSGISGNVDKDRFNGTLADLKVLAHVTAAPPPPPAPAPAPAQATTATLTPSSSAVVKNLRVTFSGTVRTRTAPAVGQTVALARRVAGSSSWIRVATTVTSSTGAYSIPATVDQSASYMVHALASSAYLSSWSPSVQVKVVPPTATATSLAADVPSVLPGGTVTFAGAVTTTTSPAQPLAGRTVALARRVAGSSAWVRVATAVTDTSGAYRFSAVVDQAAAYRVHDLPDPTYLESVSPSVKVAMLQPTAATVTPTAPGAYAGGKVVLAGAVTTVGQAAPVANRTVELTRRVAGSTSWTLVTTTATDASGSFTVPVVVNQSAAYRVRALGDATYAASTSKAVSVALIPPARTYLDVNGPSAAVKRGQTVRLYGHLRTRAADGSTVPLGDRWVSLWRHPVGSSTWQRCGGYRSLSTGWWMVTPRVWKDTVFQARWHGTARYAPVSSRTFTVRTTSG